MHLFYDIIYLFMRVIIYEKMWVMISQLGGELLLQSYRILFRNEWLHPFRVRNVRICGFLLSFAHLFGVQGERR